MQEDRITWTTLAPYCGFRLQSKTQIFCRNEYNCTGVCNERSCPLANSQYATIREHNGICYLYTKTIERSHFLNRLWEKVKLSPKLSKAIEQIENELMYWPKFNRVACKKRLMKIHQYLIRTKKLKLTPLEKQIIPVRRKIDRREKRREVKALKAANIENKIEHELIQRLKSGMYNELYSFPLSAFDKALSDPKKELEIQDVEEENSDLESVYDREFVMDSDLGSDYEISDIEDLEKEMEELGDWKRDIEKKKALVKKLNVKHKTTNVNSATKSKIAEKQTLKLPSNL